MEKCRRELSGWHMFYLDWVIWYIGVKTHQILQTLHLRSVHFTLYNYTSIERDWEREGNTKSRNVLLVVEFQALVREVFWGEKTHLPSLSARLECVIQDSVWSPWDIWIPLCLGINAEQKATPEIWNSSCFSPSPEFLVWHHGNSTGFLYRLHKWPCWHPPSRKKQKYH